MKFDFQSYRKMIRLLKNNKYTIIDYNQSNVIDKCAILRHDVDMSLEAAVNLSKIEKDENVFSTYFLLLSTDFYNVSSKKSQNLIKIIQNNGGRIGLHFDETKYNIHDELGVAQYVNKEIRELSSICEQDVWVVSMHRPSKMILEEDITIPGVINTYSSRFVRDFKYMSDSRRTWKENVEDTICSGNYDKLHILTHPIWYREKEQDVSIVLKDFIRFKKKECYEALRQNIRNLAEFIRWEDCRE